MTNEEIQGQVAGHFRLGENVLVYCPSLPRLSGPSVITEKDYRVCIDCMTDKPVTGWVYRTDRMSADGAWLGERSIHKYPEPAWQEYTAQLLAALRGQQ